MKTISKHKSKELTIHLFQIPIYDSKICFLKYDNDKGYNKAIECIKRFGVKDEVYETDEYRYAFGFVSKEKTKYGIVHFIFMNNCKEYKKDYSNTLSHENYHLVNNICKYHGIVFDHEGDNEAHAYLTGYLFQILSTL